HARQPQEKLLDGRVFDEWALYMPLASQLRLVAGMHRGVVAPAEAAPPAENEAQPAVVLAEDERAELSALRPDALPREQAEQAEAVEEPAGARAAPQFEPLPPHFGRQLLTGRRLGRNVQVLLVITFDDVNKRVDE